MIVNTRGVEINNTNYIKEAGQYAFKITKFEEDGYNKFKLTFVGNRIIVIDGKPKLEDTLYTHTERYSLESNVLWKIKILELALKAPEVYDVNDFVGRFVRADVGMREHNGKWYSEIKAWHYSKQNDSLPPIPEAQENQSYGANEPRQSERPNPIDDDIDLDSIPF